MDVTVVGGQTAGGHPKASPRSRHPLFAVPALRELESAGSVSPLWDVVFYSFSTACCRDFSTMLDIVTSHDGSSLKTSTFGIARCGVEQPAVRLKAADRFSLGDGCGLPTTLWLQLMRDVCPPPCRLGRVKDIQNPPTFPHPAPRMREVVHGPGTVPEGVTSSAPIPDHPKWCFGRVSLTALPRDDSCICSAFGLAFVANSMASAQDIGCSRSLQIGVYWKWGPSESWQFFCLLWLLLPHKLFWGFSEVLVVTAGLKLKWCFHPQ